MSWNDEEHVEMAHPMHGFWALLSRGSAVLGVLLGLVGAVAIVRHPSGLAPLPEYPAEEYCGELRLNCKHVLPSWYHSLPYGERVRDAAEARLRQGVLDIADALEDEPHTPALAAMEGRADATPELRSEVEESRRRHWESLAASRGIRPLTTQEWLERLPEASRIPYRSDPVALPEGRPWTSWAEVETARMASREEAAYDRAVRQRANELYEAHDADLDRARLEWADRQSEVTNGRAGIVALGAALMLLGVSARTGRWAADIAPFAVVLTRHGVIVDGDRRELATFDDADLQALDAELTARGHAAPDPHALARGLRERRDALQSGVLPSPEDQAALDRLRG